MKSALGYFEALTEMGIAPNFGELCEFNFSKNNYKGETIILSHQITFPEIYVDSLEQFVKNGGKLIVDGLTAFFDESMHNTMKTGFDFQNLFGGNISEFKLVSDIFQLNINGLELPSHLWKGFIVPSTGIPIGDIEQETLALRNKFGKGEVFWVPSLIGLGSRMTGDYSQLIKLLGAELEESMAGIPIKFKSPQKNLLMKTLKSGSNFVTVLINKSDKSLSQEMDFKIKNTKSKVLFANKNGKINGSTVIIEPEETIVFLWN